MKASVIERLMFRFSGDHPDANPLDLHGLARLRHVVRRNLECQENPDAPPLGQWETHVPAEDAALAIDELAAKLDTVNEVLLYMLTDEVPPEGNADYRAMLRERLTS